MQSKHPGFTFIELILVMAILAALLATGINRLRQPLRYERETFVAQLNALLFVGWKTAIRTARLQRISCDFQKRVCAIATATDDIDLKNGEPQFIPLSSKYGRTSLPIPANIKIEQFFIEGHDEMNRTDGKKSGETWFYLTPGGLAQAVTINFVDLKDRIEKKPRPVGLVLNPFSAQFEIYDTFQK